MKLKVYRKSEEAGIPLPESVSPRGFQADSVV
jgi:hypothetical protein